ncbi:MAG: glycosyltransferase family 4 protein [Eubacterium sp.]|nr:glycosyltransferase family 4 protein [Eubacterium sp.]
MKKPSLLYASPFAPMKSGISDYSEILVYALKNEFEITLLIDDYKLENKNLYHDFDVVVYGKDNVPFEAYDYIVYNIGNNQDFHCYIYELCLEHPGMVILHDFVIYCLIYGYYEKMDRVYSKIYEIGGSEALLKVKYAVKEAGRDLLKYWEIVSELPLNRELAESGNKIMVHSQYALDQLSRYNVCARQINMIQQVSEEFREIEKQVLLERYSIPEDAFLICSFGGIGQTKLNHIVCEVISDIKDSLDKPICYVMVGDGDYVDEFIDYRYIFKTGYVNMDEFDSLILHSDLILNLRYPSMGETSAALLKILQMGKACIINEGGWFSEIPDECVIKVSREDMKNDLKNAILYYLREQEKREFVGDSAKKYIEKEYNTAAIVQNITQFLRE